MANFTPEELEEILQQFFDVTGKRQYIGARYVPIFGRKDEDSIIWDNSAPYEPLTIVLYQGNSYTSRTYVPEGVEITNTYFWANTGNYNAQVEQYRRDVAQAVEDFREYTEQAIEDFRESTDAAVNQVDEWLTEAQEMYSTKPFAFDTVVDMQTYEGLYDGAICHTNGFHASGDGGAAYYNISTSGPADGTTIIECANSLYAHLVNDFELTPSIFAGVTDYAQIQACIDFAIANNVRVIRIDRRYDITNSTILVNLPETNNSRTLLRLVGSGKGEIYKGDSSGYVFDSISGVLSHGLVLENLHVTGNAASDSTARASVFNTRNIIRITSINCYYYGLKYVFDGCDPNGRTVMQSMRGYNNSYITCRAAMCADCTITDCTFDGELVEHRSDYGFLFGENTTSGIAIINLNILNCVIEGTLEGGIYLVGSSDYYIQAAMVNIKNCYFEGNTGYSISITCHGNSIVIDGCSFSNINTLAGIYLDASQLNGAHCVSVRNIFNSGYSTDMIVVMNATRRMYDYYGYAQNVTSIMSAETKQYFWLHPVIPVDYYIQTSDNGTFAPQMKQQITADFLITRSVWLIEVHDTTDYKNKYYMGLFVIDTADYGSDAIQTIQLKNQDLYISATNAQGTFVISGGTGPYVAHIKLIGSKVNQ